MCIRDRFNLEAYRTEPGATVDYSVRVYTVSYTHLALQDELAAAEYNASAGGGAVAVSSALRIASLREAIRLSLIHIYASKLNLPYGESDEHKNVY